MLIGYIRTSTAEQNSIRQEVLMNELIVQSAIPYPDYSNFIDSDERWFIEKVLEEVKTDE